MSIQSHRERVFNTLHGERPDRLACGEFFVADEFIRGFLGLGAQTAIQFSHQRRVIEALDLDIASVSLSAGWGALEQPDENRALDWLMQWSSSSDRFVFALIDGPFSAAAKARGFNMLLHYVRGAPHAARELFQQGAEEARLVAQAARDAGANGVILGEDIAYGKSTYVAPDNLRDLYFPELERAAAAMRALGLVVFFHSDGNLNAVLPDLGRCQLDGIQGLEPEAGMQMAATRVLVGPALTLWGNLGFDFLSAPRAEDEVSDAVRAAQSGAGQTGGFILGSCAGLVQGLDLETVRRVYRTAFR